MNKLGLVIAGFVFIAAGYLSESRQVLAFGVILLGAAVVSGGSDPD